MYNTQVKKDFNFEEKIKVWLHYVASVSFFNNDLLEVDVNNHTAKHYGDDFVKLIKYPNLIPNKIFIKVEDKIKTKSFDAFCSNKDSRKSETLLGYYWRFEKQIKL